MLQTDFGNITKSSDAINPFNLPDSNPNYDTVSKYKQDGGNYWRFWLKYILWICVYGGVKSDNSLELLYLNLYHYFLQVQIHNR